MMRSWDNSGDGRDEYDYEDSPRERVILLGRVSEDVAPTEGPYFFSAFDSRIPYVTEYELKQSIDQRVENVRGRTRPWERTDCQAGPSTILKKKKKKVQGSARKAPRLRRLLDRMESRVVRAEKEIVRAQKQVQSLREVLAQARQEMDLMSSDEETSSYFESEEGRPKKSRMTSKD